MNRNAALLLTGLLSFAIAGCSSNPNSKTTADMSPSGTPTTNVSPSATAGPTATPKYADQPNAATATQPCGTKTAAHPAVASKLPKGFPVVTGWTPTQSVTQGKTVAVRGVVKGTPDRIVQVRDEAFAKITKAGYTKTGSDEEPGFEADGDFTPRGGNINVKTLCQNYLVVTYTFSQ